MTREQALSRTRVGKRAAVLRQRMRNGLCVSLRLQLMEATALGGDPTPSLCHSLPPEPDNPI